MAYQIRRKGATVTLEAEKIFAWFHYIFLPGGPQGVSKRVRPVNMDCVFYYCNVPDKIPFLIESLGVSEIWTPTALELGHFYFILQHLMNFENKYKDQAIYFDLEGGKPMLIVSFFNDPDFFEAEIYPLLGAISGQIKTEGYQ